jgi:DNA-binding HxlR family transcriptional regulator
MRWRSVQDTSCSIARTLSVVGERWTLLILREVFLGASRFDELRDRLDIARNVLAQRLSHLVDNGVLEKELYCERPRRYSYRLTERGRDLYPVLLSLMAWGDRWLSEDEAPPASLTHRACGHTTRGEIVCAHCHEPLHPEDTRVRLGADRLRASRPDRTPPTSSRSTHT